MIIGIWLLLLGFMSLISHQSCRNKPIKRLYCHLLQNTATLNETCDRLSVTVAVVCFLYFIHVGIFCFYQPMIINIDQSYINISDKCSSDNRKWRWWEKKLEGLKKKRAVGDGNGALWRPAGVRHHRRRNDASDETKVSRFTPFKKKKRKIRFIWKYAILLWYLPQISVY